MKFLGGELSKLSVGPHDSILHSNTFSIVQELCQLELRCKIYAS